MVLVYRGGPYASQDDYLVPLPDLVTACGGGGYYQRTADTDSAGRVIYKWVPTIPEAHPDELPAIAS